jgi:hypothetical protein
MVPYGTGIPGTELFAVYFCSCDNILTLVNFERNENPCETLFDVKIFKKAVIQAVFLSWVHLLNANPKRLQL